MLHDTKTEGDNLSREEEIDDLSIVRGVDRLVTGWFDEGADDTKRGKTKVLEGSSFRSRVQKRI